MALFWAVNATACVPVVRFGPDRQEQSWPAYLGNPRHDIAANESLNPDPRPLWRVDVGHAVRGSPAFGETILAVGTVDRTVVLVNRESGDVLWRQRLGGTINGGPLLDGDRLYAATEATPDAKLYALRLRTGKPLWSKSAPAGIAAPLALDGDALYAATEHGTVLRLDTENGAQRWRRALGAAIRVAPVPTPHGLVVTTTADTLYLLKPETGEVLASLATPGTVLDAPAYAGTRLYAGTSSGHVLAIDLPTLHVGWDHQAGDAVYGAPALVRDTLYVLARNGVLWIIPAGGPRAARSLRLDIVATAAPTPIAGGVLVGAVSGEVLLVDQASGAIKWRVQLDGPIEGPPLVRDRQLVVVAGRGDIHAYR